MKYTIFISTGKENDLKVKAYGKDDASIFITANDLKEAKELLTNGEKMAEKVCQEWTAAEPCEKEKTFSLSGKSAEKINEEVAEYEATPEGKLFIKELKNAIAFKQNHNESNIDLLQLKYLANKNNNNLINGSYDLIALSYKQGYEDGKASAK